MKAMRDHLTFWQIVGGFSKRESWPDRAAYTMAAVTTFVQEYRTCTSSHIWQYI